MSRRTSHVVQAIWDGHTPDGVATMECSVCGPIGTVDSEDAAHGVALRHLIEARAGLHPVPPQGVLETSWGHVRAAFQWLARPFRRPSSGFAPRAIPVDLFMEDNDQETRDWISAERDRLLWWRIDHMKRWERTTRRTLVMDCLFVLFNVYLVVRLDGWLTALNALSAGFIIAMAGYSVAMFSNARDQFLQELEDDPDTDPSMFHDYTLKRRG